MTRLTEAELDIFEDLFAQARLSVIILNNVGNVMWFNPMAQQCLDRTTRLEAPLVPQEDWSRLQEMLQDGSAFQYFLGDQSWTFFPQVLTHQHQTRYLLRLMPSSATHTREVDIATLQEDLLHQRKLANLGRMMLELAHELNNPLTGISMGSQLIGMSLKKLKRLLTDKQSNEAAITELVRKIENELSKINDSTHRAASLRQELMSYSKPNHMELRPFQTKKMIQRAFDNFGSHPVFRSMQVHFELSEMSPTILCDPAKMEQILYNLMKNAHDATQGQGEVWIREGFDAEQNRVIIEFEDNGPGIPATMLNKIFSPFLTTKPRSGTGLGLSISQQIILQHGGHFSVYNNPHGGACFRIMLPLLEEGIEGLLGNRGTVK